MDFGVPVPFKNGSERFTVAANRALFQPLTKR